MMKSTVTLAICVFSLFALVIDGYGQRYARSDGAWSAAIWASTPNGVAGSASTPGASDNVYTNGFQISSSSSVSCKDLYIDSNRGTASIVLSSFAVLTVNGTLTGWDGSGDAVPVANCITFSGNSALRLTGSNITGTNYLPDYVIYAFDDTSPIGRIRFDFGPGVTRRIIAPLSVTTTFTMTSGTLAPDGGAFIQIGSSGSMVISAGSTITTSDPIHGGSSSSLFSGLTISGTLTTSSYVNATNFTFNSGGTLNTSFSGANQTEGWWFQSNRPTGSQTMDPNFTINYSSSSAQNIYTTSYGNLTLSGISIKTPAGGGSISIAGNLTFSNATLNSSQLVALNGSSSQSVSGPGTANFNGGLQINNSGGTVTLNKTISIQNGLTITSGNLDLGSNTVNLSGNLSMNGTITPSGSTLVITGSTSVTSGSPSLNNLTINGGGNFTAPAALIIAGNLANSGTFSANNGTITFNGSTAQSVTGTLTFFNVICNSTGGLNINGNANLAGTLTLGTSGVFDADGSGSGVFTVLSTNVISGGAIAALPTPANFSGDVTIQRYIHSQAGGDWRYISVPITTGNNLSLIQNALGVTGNFSDRSTNAQFSNISDSGNTNPSVYSFSSNAYVAVNGTGGAVAATNLSSRTGYAAYNYNNGSVTASYRGQIEKGNNIVVSVSSNNGDFNLVPNPFPSAIDWDNVTRPNVNNAIWLRIANNSFTSYVNGVGANLPFGGWTGEIATGQAFWVQSNGSGNTLTFKEADKTSNTAQFLRQENPINYFRIKLASGTQSDDAVIRFNEGGSDNFDPNFDAFKRKNGNYVSSLGANSYLNISTYISGSATDYAINTVNQINCIKTINIKVADVTPGNYVITFGDLDKMQLGYSILLRDNLLNKDVVVNESTNYTFAVTSDPNTYGSNRFVINFASPQVAANAPTYAFSNLCESQIQYQLSTQAGINYQITKSGSVLATIIGNGNQVSGFISKSIFSTGNNVFDLQAASLDGCNKVTFPGALSINLQQTPSVTSVTSTTVCNTGNSTLTAVGAPADGQYRWYFSADAKNSIAGQIGSTFTTPVISETTSFFVATINGQGCEGPRTSVQAVVSKLAKPSISVTGFLLSSSISEGNQWFKNGAKIEGATGSTITVLESGTYSVSVQNAAGCTQTSDNLVMSIAALEDARSLGISIYPNPAAEELKMRIPAPMVEQISSLGVIDIKGSGSVFSDAIQENVTIPVGHLPSGVYFARIRIGNEFKFLRFIKK